VQTGAEAALVVQGAAPQNEQAVVSWEASAATDDGAPVDPSGLPGEPTIQPGNGALRGQQPSHQLEGSDGNCEPVPDLLAPSRIPATDFDLDELASELVRVRVWNATETCTAPGSPCNGAMRASRALNPLLRDGSTRQSETRRVPRSLPSALAAILLAAGFCGHGSRIATASTQKAKDSRTALSGRGSVPDFRLGRNRHHSPAHGESHQPR
jgi:hypothetical protein